MAEIPFIDTHFHLHDLKRPELRYSWLERDAIHGFLGNIDALKAQHYWIDDYIAEIRFANVPKAIHVQAALGTPDPVNETKWLQAFADKTGYPQGIVAECHLPIRMPKPCSIGTCNTPTSAAFAISAAAATSSTPPGAPASNSSSGTIWSLASTRASSSSTISSISPPLFRTSSICIDHCAIPEARDDAYFKRWSTAMRALARAENVVMKISGLGMMDRRWTVESLRPWVLGSIEAFGVDRVVFGTNWPVDRMFSSYPDLINAYATIISAFTKDEQIAMFSGNAERLFRI